MFFRLVVIYLAVTLCKTCSPVPGWQPSTVEQQVQHAGAIIYGKVDSVNQDQNKFSFNIHLVNAFFFKGCGFNYVRINGFTSSAACGLDPPNIGDNVIVFVCRDGYHWALNQINLHTGMVSASRNNIMTVRRLTSGTKRCDGCTIRYSRCTKPSQFQQLDVERLNLTQ